jgi:hypothetical protein
MKFAQRSFFVAGVYGVILLAPMFFLEDYLGREFPPPITHPELFYGFLGAVFAWQLVYLLISRDPLRYRPVMILAILAKVSYGMTTVILLAQGRVPGMIALGGGIDLILAAFFAYSYLVTDKLAGPGWPK